MPNRSTSCPTIWTSGSWRKAFQDLILVKAAGSTICHLIPTGLDEPIKRCMRDEQKARDQFKPRWSQLAAHDRIVCIGETYDTSGMPPSYGVLSTCLLRPGVAKNPTN